MQLNLLVAVPTRLACVLALLLEEVLDLAIGAGLSHPKFPQANPIHPLNLMSGSSAVASLDSSLSGYVAPSLSSYAAELTNLRL